MRKLVTVVSALVGSALAAGSCLAADIDWAPVDQAIGRKGAAQPGGIYKYGLPRSDFKVTGATIAKWGERKLERQARFLSKFLHVPETEETAKVCGVLHGERERIGRRIEWPDAWAAACALWLDVPLVTHDRDHEGIPGLRVLTLHQHRQVREEGIGTFSSGALWLGERSFRFNAPIH